jgi:histidinol-phosphate aminotransferase
LATGQQTDSTAAACAEAGVVVRPFSGEGLRVTIGEPEANDIFLKVAADLSPR